MLPDLRGHGKSFSDDFSNYFEAAASDVKDTMDKIDLESAHIVGCSLGGLIALFFAKMYGKRAKSLTISGVIPEKPENWSELQLIDNESISNLLENEEAVKHFNEKHMSDWKRFLLIGQSEDWYPFDVTKNVSDLKMPTLFLVGEGYNHEVKGALTYPAMNKNIHLAIIPFASHLVHIEQPHLYSMILERFLTEIHS
ncbi:alpha/beta fold hydrolase [Peribacillus deserti]|uniref:alpha/beta fold hydrolase n=1 Tax=Peribacillus deserti TaxID=673318 RepID=UPI0021523985|nr:alpha/beta hydrolase [Peribacillus deserti]